MNDKKKNMLSNVKFWAMTCEMEELENEEEFFKESFKKEETDSQTDNSSSADSSES